MNMSHYFKYRESQCECGDSLQPTGCISHEHKAALVNHETANSFVLLISSEHWDTMSSFANWYVATWCYIIKDFCLEKCDNYVIFLLMLPNWGVASFRTSLFWMTFELTCEHSLGRVVQFLTLSFQQLGSRRAPFCSLLARGESAWASILLTGFSAAEGHTKRRERFDARRPPCTRDRAGCR